MAKKEERFFLQRGPYITTGGAESKYGKETVQASFGGLNELNMIDTGEMSYAKNVCLSKYPILSRYHLANFNQITIQGGNLVGQVTYKDTLFYVTENGNTITLCKTTYGGSVYKTTFTNNFKGKHRVLIYFKDHLLIFPDNVVYTFNVTNNSFVSAGKIDFFTSVKATIIDAVVYINRIFCISEQNVYASAYGRWDLWNDYKDEPQNAWATDNTSEGTYNSNGYFTGIYTYSGHVVAFHSDYLFEIYNNKNPFRIQDVYSKGTISGASVQETAGGLYFMGVDGLYRYSGGIPKKISDKLPDLTTLNDREITKVLSASYGENYYLYTEDSDGNSVINIFDTAFGGWTKALNDMQLDGLFTYNFTRSSETLFNIDSTASAALIAVSGTNVYEIHNFDDRNNVASEFVVRFSYNTLNSLEAKYIREIKLMYSSAQSVKLSVYKTNASRTGGFPIREKSLPAGTDSVGTVDVPNSCSEAFQIEVKTSGDIQINKIVAKYILK